MDAADSPSPRGPKPSSIESGHHAPGLAFVRLHGEHDLTSEAKLQSALARAAAHSHVLVDLSDCTFMDSTVIKWLIRAGRAVEARGERLVLAIPPAQRDVARLAQMVHLGEIMPVFESHDDALAYLQQAISEGGAG
jgi:anti-anti-sigma factor